MSCLAYFVVKKPHSVRVTFIDPDGTEHKVVAKAGMNLLQVAHKNDINMEGVTI